MTMNIVICNKKSIKTARAAFQAKFCTAGIEDNAPSEKATYGETDKGGGARFF